MITLTTTLNICFFLLPLLFKIFYLKFRFTENKRENERPRVKDREGDPSFAGSLSNHKNQGWAGSKLESATSFVPCTSIWTILCCFPKPKRGSWTGSETASIKPVPIQDTNVTSRELAIYSIMSAPYFNFN